MSHFTLLTDVQAVLLVLAAVFSAGVAVGHFAIPTSSGDRIIG